MSKGEGFGNTNVKKPTNVIARMAISYVQSND